MTTPIHAAARAIRTPSTHHTTSQRRHAHLAGVPAWAQGYGAVASLNAFTSPIAANQAASIANALTNALDNLSGKELLARVKAQVGSILKAIKQFPKQIRKQIISKIIDGLDHIKPSVPARVIPFIEAMQSNLRARLQHDRV